MPQYFGYAGTKSRSNRRNLSLAAQRDAKRRAQRQDIKGRGKPTGNFVITVIRIENNCE